MKKLIIAIPAYNEEKIIRSSLLVLTGYMRAKMNDYDWRIIVADNGSTDQTRVFTQRAKVNEPHIEYIFIPTQGKGNAIRTAWKQFPADIHCFMDADLSTDIRDLHTLIQAVEFGADTACGSRRMADSNIQRSFIRKIISLGNNFLLHAALNTKLTDTPCGFKAVNATIITNILDQVENNAWFFDTELLIRAEQAGYLIKEIPVQWSDGHDKIRKSGVGLFLVCKEYINNIFHLRKNLKHNVHTQQK